MPVICSCPRTQLCDRCFAQALETLTSTAWRRGVHWAETVAKRRPDLIAQPWPALDGRCREIAARKVVDLNEDLRVLERLLIELDASARKRWEELRVRR